MFGLMTMLKHILYAVLLLVGLLFGDFRADADSNTMTEIPKSLSPNHSLALFVINGSTNLAERLVLMSLVDKAALAEFSIPKAVSVLRQPLATTSIAWKHDNTGVAVSFSDKTSSYIYGCVTTTSGRFKWIDFGMSEGANLGILGRSRIDFVRVEDTPTHWTDANEWSPRMVWVRSRFWDRTGQRYTVEQEFSISPTGEIGIK
jgi:hypothetical protein